MRIVRSLARALFVLGICCGALLFVGVPWIIERYHSEIESHLSADLNGRLRFDSAAVTLYPDPGVALSGARFVSNHDAAMRVDAAIPTAVVELRLRSLLRGDLEVTSARIERPTISIDADETRETSETSSTANSTSGGLSALRLDDIEIVDGAFHLMNRVSGDSVAINGLYFTGWIALAPTEGSVGLKRCDLKDAVWRFGASSGELGPSSLTGVLRGGPRSVFAQKLDLALSLRQLGARPRPKTPIPLRLESESLSYDVASSVVSVSALSSQLGAGKVTLHGSMNLRTPDATLSAKGDQINLAELSDLGKAFVGDGAWKTPQGLLSFALDYRADSAGALLNGELLARRLSALGGALKVGSLKLSEFTAHSVPTGWTAGSGVELDDLEVADGTGSFYRATKVRGRFVPTTAKRKGERVWSGGATVKGFGYRDAAVDLSDVDAELSTIVTRVGGDGGIEVSLTVAGSRLALVESTVQVHSVREVAAPLVIAIPARGGYRVSGPVAARGVTAVLAGRKLSEVGGKVEILVSGPLKRFIAGELYGDIGGERFTAPSSFEMTSQRFSARSKIKAYGGDTVGSFSLERGGKRLFQVSANSSGTDLSRAVSSLRGDATDAVDGTIRTLTIDARGPWATRITDTEGRAAVVIQNGFVREINVDGLFHSLLQNIPLVGDGVSSTKAKPGDPNDDTFTWLPSSVPSLAATFAIGRGALTTNDLTINGRLGTIKAQGQYLFDKGVNLNGSMVFLEEKFRALGGPIGVLKDLFGGLGRIEIPFVVTGPLVNVKVRGDASRLASTNGATRLANQVLRGVGRGVEGVGSALLSPFRSSTPTPGPEGASVVGR